MSRRGAGWWGAGALSVALLASACAPSARDSGGSPGPAGGTPVSVVASTAVYGDIAKQIAGGAASVTAIITDPGVDPHSYQASARTQLTLSRADVVIENGGGYDDFVDTLLRSAGNSRATVLNAVDISGRTAGGDTQLNEHVWYDLPAMAKLSDQLAGALSAADPPHAPAFTANADAFKQKVRRLAAVAASIRSAHAGTGVAVTEPVPLYLLAACGLVNRTPAAFSQAIEEGTGVPAAVLRRTLDLFARQDVALLAYNEQSFGPQAQQVRAAAHSNDVPVVPVTETLPDGKDYLTWMSDNLSAIQRALDGAPA